MNDLIRFEDVELAVIDRDGQRWLAAADIAAALGYGRADKVTHLYTRNAGEFSEAMTCVLKVRTQGGLEPQNGVAAPDLRAQSGHAATDQRRDVRVFSLRGAHLVAMLARTPRARAFRAWALDLIEAELATLRDPGRGRDAVTARLARALYLDGPQLATETEMLAERDPAAAALALRHLSSCLRDAEASRDAVLRRMALDEGDGPRIDLRTAASHNLARLTIEQRAIEDLTDRIRRVAGLLAPEGAL